MDWVHTLTIISSFLGMFIYMLMRQDKLTETISESNRRISIIEGYLFKRLEQESKK